MNLHDVVQTLDLVTFVPGDGEVRGGYVGDLLSHVLSSATPGSLWITIQHHANIVAVAQVADLTAVLIVDGRTPDDEVRSRAEAAGLPLLGTSWGAFEAAGRLHAVLEGRR